MWPPLLAFTLLLVSNSAHVNESHFGTTCHDLKCLHFYSGNLNLNSLRHSECKLFGRLICLRWAIERDTNGLWDKNRKWDELIAVIVLSKTVWSIGSSEQKVFMQRPSMSHVWQMAGMCCAEPVRQEVAWDSLSRWEVLAKDKVLVTVAVRWASAASPRWSHFHAQDLLCLAPTTC